MTIRTAATVVLALLTGCAAPGDDSDETGEAAANGNAVTGSVSYRERMALPHDATIEVWITDVSDSAAPGAMLAETAIEPEGRQVPIPFELRYDPAAVNADHTYAVKATIRSGGQIMFSTAADYYVITQGNPTAIDLMLQRGTGGGDPTAGANPLQGTSWRLQEIGGSSALADVEATIEFSEEGRVAGNASCNQFAGSVVISSETITFQPLVLTRMACLEAINAQEDLYVRALEAAERYTVSGDELLIHTSTADQPLRFTRIS
jgi:putative lipoprotein